MSSHPQQTPLVMCKDQMKSTSESLLSPKSCGLLRNKIYKTRLFHHLVQKSETGMLCFKIAEIDCWHLGGHPSVGFCRSTETDAFFLSQREWLCVTSAQLCAYTEELEPNGALSAKCNELCVSWEYLNHCCPAFQHHYSLFAANANYYLDKRLSNICLGFM